MSGTAEVLVKIAFIGFIIIWPVIVTYRLIYLEDAYLCIAFGSVHEKCLHFAPNNSSYQTLLFTLWIYINRRRYH